MKNNKGFTLIGLLIFILIVAGFIFIVIPALKNNTTETKEFTSEIRKIYQGITTDENAEKFDVAYTNSGACYSLTDESLRLTNVKKMDINTNLRYYIELDSSGNIVKFYAYNDKYQLAYKGDNFKLLDVGKTTINSLTKRNFMLGEDSYNDGIISRDELRKFCDYEFIDEEVNKVDSVSF